MATEDDIEVAYGVHLDLEEAASVRASSAYARKKRFSRGWVREKVAVAAMRRRAAAGWEQALHVWTNELIASASSIGLAMPSPSVLIKSARGSERDHGAAVKDTANVNRSLAAQTPAKGQALSVV
jgi:hypothetical protein